MDDRVPEHLPSRLSAALLDTERLPWFKRLLVRVKHIGLRRRPAASWSDEYLDGYLAGHYEGVREGMREGYAEGHLEGMERGRRMLLIRDLRPEQPAGPQIEAHLFDDWRLPLTRDVIERFKADVAHRLPADAQPGEAQWAMILSDTPSTCVIAGAGAGKSTSLVLRIVLLTLYLGVAPDSLTVVTFTRESRKDFIARLSDIMALWGQPLGAGQARDIVRTFHSRILPMVRSLPGLERLQAFENLGAPAHAAEDEGAANPFDLRIGDAQRQALVHCHAHLYANDPRFAQVIAALYLQALQLRSLSREHPDVRKRLAVIELAARRDPDWCDRVEDLWRQAGAWPIEGIEAQRHSVQLDGHVFALHGYVPALQAWVVLGLDPREDRELKRDGARLPLGAEGAIKRTLLQALCRKPVIWLDSYQAAVQLLPAMACAGPGFEYRVRGEPAAVSLLDAWVTAAGFIESLGLDVAGAVAQMSFARDDTDRLFFEALGLFWPAFEAQLLDRVPPVMTFNRMFALFGESAPENLQQLDDEALRPLTNLMIDEFQDVSPQIVAWLRACLREIRRRAQYLPAASQASLLCVGDDWQSIYGWRGSSPHYLMAFASEFSSPATTRVMLNDNYRSHQHIIDAAEHIVRAAPAIEGKKARACSPDPQCWPVTLLDRDDPSLYERVLGHYQAGDSILLLYRKASERQRLPAPLLELLASDAAQQRRIRTLTYHSAKGLQADAVFLLGDCRHLNRSPARNQLYRLAGLGAPGEPQGYDQAQHDEALRLAYVAITRTVRQCYWFLEAADQQAGSSAGQHVAAQQPFFNDLRRTAVD